MALKIEINLDLERFMQTQISYKTDMMIIYDYAINEYLFWRIGWPNDWGIIIKGWVGQK
jgi:hypothetical protein